MRPIIEHMSKMTVGMTGTDFRGAHPVGPIMPLFHILGLYMLRKTRPPATAVEFIQG